ncbi:hypothetical protein HY389_02405 [Candidatus Daviesbacteria bacterium]|nr:hypothetical protein [Candidatus Daviesbacteria bacterium]
MRYFYSNIIEIDSVITRLDELGLSEEQKMHLAQLIDSTIHHSVLDLILSELSEADKKQFIQKLNDDPSDQKLLEFLEKRVDDIETKIKTTADKLKEEIHEDIKQASRIRTKHD